MTIDIGLAKSGTLIGYNFLSPLGAVAIAQIKNNPNENMLTNPKEIELAAI